MVERRDWTMGSGWNCCVVPALERVVPRSDIVEKSKTLTLSNFFNASNGEMTTGKRVAGRDMMSKAKQRREKGCIVMWFLASRSVDRDRRGRWESVEPVRSLAGEGRWPDLVVTVTWTMKNGDL